MSSPNVAGNGSRSRSSNSDGNSNSSSPPEDLGASSITMPSDSENYGNNELSSSRRGSSSSDTAPVILYRPPTVWSLLRGAAINLFLPFVNGLMLGFGELFAHELAFRFGWSQTKVFPGGRASRPAGPGVEIQEDLGRKRRTGTLEDLTSLE